jgi:hypothetical protein
MAKHTKVTVNVKAKGNARVTVNVQTAPEKKAKRKRAERAIEKAIREAPLSFGEGNAKLADWIGTFSLPAGWTCPGAKACLARVSRETGTVTDGADVEFRCFSASQEVRPNVRDSRWGNFDALKEARTVARMADLIEASIPDGSRAVRIHVSGDFWSQAYLDAWLLVARRRPELLFYFYTKSLKFWLARIDLIGDGHTPGALPNVVPTASRGGKYDDMIELHGLREARVVLYDDEADELGLPIDHDDGHAMKHGGDFALSLHGAQPKGSDAARAIAWRRKQGDYGYGEKADARREESKRVALAVLS